MLSVLCFAGWSYAGWCCAQTSGLEPIVVQLNGQFNFGKSGYVAAIEKGFYTEEGLQVTLRASEQANHDIQAVLSGEAQFGNSGTRAFQSFLHGEPLVALGAIYQDSGYNLLIRHDSGIATPQDLIGKTVVLTGLHQDYEVLATIQSAGVDLNRIRFVTRKEIPVERRADYLLLKRADAVMSRSAGDDYAPYLEAGLAVRTLKPLDHRVRFYQNLIVVRRDYLEQYPETCREFYRATIRGWRYAITHPNEMVELFEKHYPQRVDSKNSLDTQIINAYERIGVEGIGVMDVGRWERIAEAYAALGLAEPGIDVAPFVYDPDPEPDLAWVAWVVGLGAGSACLALGVLLWNRELSRRVHEQTRSLRQAERRQQLMMRELDHRVKNNLAAVISLSNRTLSASVTLGEFGQSFNGRLRTMASTHEALAKGRWEGVDLHRAARRALHGHLFSNGRENADEDGAITIEGRDVTLPSSAAIPVSMALHELCTNASKYGALTTPTGRVRLAWDQADDGTVRLRWEESGGPPVVGPIHPGTGIGLIRGLIEYQLQGRVTIEPGESGVVCVLEIPSRVRESA